MVISELDTRVTREVFYNEEPLSNAHNQLQVGIVGILNNGYSISHTQ